MAQSFIFSSRIEQASYYSVGNPGHFQDINTFPNDTGLGQFCRPGDFMHGPVLTPNVPHAWACYQFGTNNGQVARAITQLGAANDNASTSGTWQFSAIDWDCEYNGVTNPPVLSDVQSLRAAVTAYNSRNPTRPLKFYGFFHTTLLTAQVASYVDGGSVGNSGLETPRPHNVAPDFVAASKPYFDILRLNTRDGVFGPRLGSFWTGPNHTKTHISSADTLNEFDWALKPTSQGGVGANHIEFYYGQPDPGRPGIIDPTLSYEGLAWALNAYRNGTAGGQVPTPETNKLIFQMRLANQADVDWWNGKNLPGPGNGRLRPTDVASFNPSEGSLASQITFGVVQRKWYIWQHATGGAHIAHDEIVAAGPAITVMKSAFYDPEATITPAAELGTGEQAGVAAANTDSNASGFSVWWSSDETNFDLSNNVDVIAPAADVVVVQGQNYENEANLAGANHWDDKVGNRVLRAKAAGAPLVGIQVSLNPTKGTMQNCSDAIHHAETANATGHGLYWPIKYCVMDQQGGQLSDVEAFLDQIRTAGTFAPAPTITLPVSPTSGSTLGGTTVTVNGANFTSGATVSIGGSAEQPTLVARGGGSLTFVTPVHAAGTNMTLRVTNPDTQSTGVITTTFQFVQAAPRPTVASISPVTTGPVGGGTAIVLHSGATDYLVSPKPTVAIGTVGVPSANIGTVTTSTIALTTPAGAAGAVHVVVTNNDGQSSATSGADLFTYTGSLAAPTVSGVSPSTGSTDGNDPITVTGTGFVDGGSVTVGGTLATNYTWVSATSITAATPAHAYGTVDVIVTNPDTQASATGAPDHFTFQAPAPTMDHLDKIIGPLTGGTVVTITGTGFLAGGSLGVAFGATGATAVSASDDGLTITCTTPAHAVGKVNVTVTNADGQTAFLSQAFTFRALPPVLQNLSIDHGPVAGGTATTLNGTGFATTGGGATVTFDGLGAAISSLGATAITVSTPPHGPGPVTVIVKNPDHQQSAVNGAYQYDAPLPAPTITTISPPTAPAATPTVITITGTNFVNGAKVFFGTVLGSGTSATATSLLTTTPVMPVGTVVLKVTNPDGQSVLGTFGFSGPTGNLTVFPYAVNPLPDPQAGDLLSTSGPKHLGQHIDANDTVRSLEQILVGNLWLNAAGLGLVLDGVTDDGHALNALLRQASTINGTDRYGDLGCPVILPPCRLLTNVMINVPNQMVLKGAGFETRIIAGPNFTPNLPLLRLGTGDGSDNEDMRIEDLTLDCNGVAGSSGVYSNQLNESCGAKNVNVVGAMTYGFRFDQAGNFGGLNNWLVQDCQVASHPTATGFIGYKVQSDTTQPITGTFFRCTAINNGTGFTVGFDLGGGTGEVHASLIDVHNENGYTGVQFSTNSHGQVLGLQSTGDNCAVQLDTIYPVVVSSIWSTTGAVLLDVPNNYHFSPNGGRLALYVNQDSIRPFTQAGVAMVYAATITLFPILGNVFTTTTVHATGNATINAGTAGVPGQGIQVIITNDATSGKTITFGTLFKASGTVVGVASKASTITFVSDGLSWYETSRTVGAL